jgi:hypothetical protein
MALSITTLCNYVECRVLFIVRLNAAMLSVVMLILGAPGIEMVKLEQRQNKLLIILSLRVIIHPLMSPKGGKNVITF